ncbi:MAG TPA: hypothetical protein VF973_15445, partial [Myxococcales bacterium]
MPIGTWELGGTVKGSPGMVLMLKGPGVMCAAVTQARTSRQHEFGFRVRRVPCPRIWKYPPGSRWRRTPCT